MAKALTHTDGIALLRANLPMRLHPQTLHSLVCAWLAYGSDNNQTAYVPMTEASKISMLIFTDGYSLSFNNRMFRLIDSNNEIVLQETFNG